MQEDLLLKSADSSYLWVQLLVNMAQHPTTGDLEAVIYILDINLKKRLEQIAEKLIAGNFETVSLIGITTGSIQCIQTPEGSHESLPFAPRDDKLNYDMQIQLELQKIMDTRDYDAVKDLLNLQHVIQSLNQDYPQEYDIHVRIKSPNTQKLRYLKLRFSYLSSYKESIMLAYEGVSDIVLSNRDVLTGLYSSNGFYHRG